jgi:hypothetical protein
MMDASRPLAAIESLAVLLLDHSGLLLVFSLLVLLVALVLLPLVIATLPEDYFSSPPPRHRRTGSRHPAVALVLVACKNLIGAALLLSGLVMLVTPGQGLLTLFAGLMLMNYPGKYALERWLVRRPGIMSGLNWVRRKSGQPPLLAPNET